VRKDGSRFWASVVITALSGPSGDLVGYSKITRDITARHKREEARTLRLERLRKRSMALEKTVQRMRDFIGITSHELRNSLTPIHLATASMAKRDLDEPLEQMRQTIDRQSVILKRLIDDLMDLNRIERGDLAIERSPFLLGDMLTGAIEASRPLMIARTHVLHTQVPTEPIALVGDAVRFSEVFINLLNNAARYTAAGGRISLIVETSRTHVTVRVVDTGQGITPDQLERVFDPFTRLAPDDSRERGGLGVGLAVVRRIVEMHGGTVEARSEGLGRGSEFIVRLPLAQRAPRPANETPRPDRDRTQSFRILCVDDDQQVATGLARLLASMGHQAVIAHTGEAALRTAHSLQPEIVLMDIDMPGMNGYEVARRLRQQQGDAQPRLVALTGWGQQSDKQRARDAGFERYVVKPVTGDALESVLAGFATVGPVVD
jgi:signal transduction histidine kinase/CheY-like chemotaxis protein